MWRDDAYLLDMLIAARRAMKHVATLSQEDFEKDELSQDAIIRTLEIIGEAAGKVSEKTRSQYSEIAWREIIGMRNRLIHEYFQINLSRVWDVIIKDLPRLISQLEEIVPPESSS